MVIITPAIFFSIKTSLGWLILIILLRLETILCCLRTQNVQNRKRGKFGGNYSVARPYMEQFALESVLGFMTRGTELYHELEGPEQANRLMDSLFPATDPQDPIDNIISECGLGRFESTAELSRRVRKMMKFDETYGGRKMDCEQYHQLVRVPGCSYSPQREDLSS